MPMPWARGRELQVDESFDDRAAASQDPATLPAFLKARFAEASRLCANGVALCDRASFLLTVDSGSAPAVLEVGGVCVGEALPWRA